MGRPVLGKTMLRRMKNGSKSSGIWREGKWNLILLCAYFSFICLVLCSVRRSPRHVNNLETRDTFSGRDWTDVKPQQIASSLKKEEMYEHHGSAEDTRLESCLKEPRDAKADEAYITFLTGNQEGYLTGVLALNHSLTTTGSTRPLVVIHISDVPEEELAYLHQAGIKTILTNSLPNPNCHGGKNRPCKRGRDNYSKLNIFGLTQYRTLVFLDSDITVRSNIDELFCFDTFAVSKIFNCFPPTDKICQNLNSGIMVIKPDTELFADIMLKYPTTYSYNSGDQGFLTTYFADKPKSYINNRMYNVKIKIKDNKPCTPDIVTALQDPTAASDVAKVVHFMDDVKPWVHFIAKDVHRVVKQENGQSSTKCFAHAINTWKQHYLAALGSVDGLKEYLLRQHRLREKTKATETLQQREQQKAQSFSNMTSGMPPHVRAVPRFSRERVRGGGWGRVNETDAPRHGWISSLMSGEVMGSSGRGSEESSSGGLEASVVIMNWKRPQNVRQILDRMVNYKAVKEILVWHCNPETVFTYDHPKVVSIVEPEANNVHGLNTRYMGCLRASFEAVITVDDDVLPLEHTINRLLQAKLQHPHCLHATHGRNPHPGCVYNFQQTPDGLEALVVLTKVMATDRRFCKAYFHYAPLMEDIARNATPMWNGEDIFMSLVSQKVTNQLPRRHSLPYSKLPGQGDGVSHNLRDHIKYRTAFLQAATSRLGLKCE